jgi:hypothetical protein
VHLQESNWRAAALRFRSRTHSSAELLSAWRQAKQTELLNSVGTGAAPPPAGAVYAPCAS